MSKINLISSDSAVLPTKFGIFQIKVFKSPDTGREHTVLLKGDIKKQPVMTRVHSQCFTGDTLFSLKCDCGQQLKQSMRIIGKKGKGIIIYLSQEGRGIGLSHKINAYKLQEGGLDTVDANLALGFPADSRDYTIAAEILKDLGISEIILLTNNPNKIQQLGKNGIKIVKRLAIEIKPNKLNQEYLRVKKLRLGHLLTRVS